MLPIDTTQLEFARKHYDIGYSLAKRILTLNPEDMGGGRLRELLNGAIVVDSDEINENDTEDAGEMAPYFDSQGRLILEHDGMSYLIETLEDDGTYFGVSNIDNLYTTDDKTNMNRDI